jgi:hypothetical protein
MSVDIATLGIKVDATEADKAAASLGGMTTAGEAAEGATSRLTAAQAALSAETRRVTAATAGAASATAQMAEAVNAQLAADTAAMAAAGGLAKAQGAAAAATATLVDAQRAAASSTVAFTDAGKISAAGMAAYEAKLLGATMAQMGMTEAQARAALGMKAVAVATKEAATAATAAAVTETAAAEVTVAAHGRIAGSSIKVRESLVILRELSRGNFTRLAGSATILAGAFGLMTTNVVATGAVIAAIAAPFAVLAVAILKGEEEMSKFNGSLIATGNYAGATAGQLASLASQVSASSDTTIGETRKTIEALTATGKFGSDAIAKPRGRCAELLAHHRRERGQVRQGIRGDEGPPGGLRREARRRLPRPHRAAGREDRPAGEDRPGGEGAGPTRRRYRPGLEGAAEAEAGRA